MIRTLKLLMTNLCLALCSIPVHGQTWEEVRTGMELLRKADENISAFVILNGLPDRTYSIKKRGNWIAAESTDDEKVHVFGPDYCFYVEKNEADQYFLNGDVTESLSFEKRVRLENLSDEQRAVWLEYYSCNSGILAPYMLLEMLRGSDLVPESIKPIDGNLVELMFRGLYDSHPNFGECLNRFVVDPSRGFRHLKTIQSYQDGGPEYVTTVDYQGDGDYSVRSFVEIESGEVREIQSWDVKKTPSQFDSGEFELSGFGIEMELRSGAWYRSTLVFVGLGVFLLCVGLAVRFKRRARNA